MTNIVDYDSLQTAVADWLDQDNLTARIPDFIMLAEQRIYRDLRIRQMETSLSSAISSGVLTIPTGYLELKHAYIDGSPSSPLVRKSPKWIYEYYNTRSASGKPLYIGRDGNDFIFGPYPDSNYTVKGIYYKKLDALSDSNTTNWLITDAPDLILFGALSEACPYLSDTDRASIYTAKFQQIKNDIDVEQRKESYSGSAISMNVSRYP